MTKVFVNAVSIKSGGGKTILESFVNEIQNDSNYYIIYSGYKCPSKIPKNVKWVFSPLSGFIACLFNLFLSGFFFYFYRAHYLLSFNNYNCVFIPSSCKVTYFHQIKANDQLNFEPKIIFLRLYLYIFDDLYIVQNNYVKNVLITIFDVNFKNIIVIWPGIQKKCSINSNYSYSKPFILVVVTDFHSQHKNLSFILEVSKVLLPCDDIVITCEDEYGLSNNYQNILFIGNKNNSDIYSLYKSAVATFMPSKYESLGLPIFESLQCGVPVIAYDAEYIRSLKDELNIGDCLRLISNPTNFNDELLMLLTSNITDETKHIVSKSTWFKLIDVISSKYI